MKVLVHYIYETCFRRLVLVNHLTKEGPRYGSARWTWCSTSCFTTSLLPVACWSWAAVRTAYYDCLQYSSFVWSGVSVCFVTSLSSDLTLLCCSSVCAPWCDAQDTDYPRSPPWLWAAPLPCSWTSTTTCVHFSPCCLLAPASNACESCRC